MGYSAMAGGKNLARGVALMLTSSLLTCVGQRLWKLSADGSLSMNTRMVYARDLGIGGN